jgi:hypothetical protein
MLDSENASASELNSAGLRQIEGHSHSLAKRASSPPTAKPPPPTTATFSSTLALQKTSSATKKKKSSKATLVHDENLPSSFEKTATTTKTMKTTPPTNTTTADAARDRKKLAKLQKQNEIAKARASTFNQLIACKNLKLKTIEDVHVTMRASISE